LLGFARPTGAGPIHFELNKTQLSDWILTFKRVESELEKKAIGYVECTQALLSLILIDLARLTSPHMSYVRGESRAVLASFFAVLEQNFQSRTNLQKIAKSVKLSPSHLTDLVRKETGKTVMEWLKSRRISEAKLLLQESDQSVKEIAYAIGYSDSNLMIRHFKQETGVSPKAWKNALALGI
jgi:AraC family transcriptional activator of pobA